MTEPDWKRRADEATRTGLALLNEGARLDAEGRHDDAAKVRREANDQLEAGAALARLHIIEGRDRA